VAPILPSTKSVISMSAPGGAELTRTGNIDQVYRLLQGQQEQLGRRLKPQCTTAAVRKVTRDLNEDVRDSLRASANSDAFQQARRARKKVEIIAMTRGRSFPSRRAALGCPQKPGDDAMQQQATEQFDLAAMVADLNSLLRLKTTVIGIKMFADITE